MKRFLLVILCLLAFPVVASHIVGGEFEILYVSGNTYRINLILYFDLNNGSAGARDPDVRARIYRKRDNAIIRNEVILNFKDEVNVNYTQPNCSVGGVRTSKLVYTITLEMTPEEFSDSKGYYIVWERCCRNYNVNKLLNIVSVDPSTNTSHPDAAGQTFYLEFPPVVRNGKPFRNSSPQLFPPLSDYGCINKPYYANFAGTDVDGDSLAYSLVTPLNTHTAEAIPTGGPGPAPFPTVKWIAPYSLNNIMGGNPDLKISKDGLLTVTPGNIEGLFVFAVKCEEFRNGVKIGELRRDFQMYVLDCHPADPPQISGRKLGDTNFTYTNTMSVNFSKNTPDNQRCIEVRITDPDVMRDGSENISIRAIPLGFNGDVSNLLPDISTATLTKSESEKIFKLCFDKCPHKFGPYQIGIIAADDACSLPLLDTLKITVNIEPPDNNPAIFTIPTGNIQQTNNYDQLVKWPIEGIDVDNDALTVKVVTNGFNFTEAGFSFTGGTLNNGLYRDTLVWDTRCRVFDFTERTNFKIRLYLDDVDGCKLEQPDITLFDLTVKLPNNAKPEIGSTLSSAALQNGIEQKVYSPITFGVFGTDSDNNELTLSGYGEGFNMSAYNISFPTATADGVVNSRFNWTPDCKTVDLRASDQYLFTFIVKEEPDYCFVSRSDTLQVNVKLLPPDNRSPSLTVTSLNPAVPLIGGDQLSMIIDQEVSLQLTATDMDVNPPDRIKIELIEASGNVKPEGYSFTPVEGLSPLNGTFNWKPDCSIYKNNVYENDYVFRFRAIDNRCFSVLSDTFNIGLKVKDIEGSDKDFIPPNFITPNGDKCNDFFALEGIEERECGEIHLANLPLDNCAGQFSSIRIYNRWGKQVFQSSQRNFRWYPDAEASGIYFYTVNYTNREYKGSLTLRY
ncbi:gliding motility-associated C-terminal domain-containing protein [Chryseosolibacter indicus]|uniref:Gliding motility-associated C-terminal domain-containing protein n=1 Tax=Chryseosolibacter indicus TaxID=2782351 RepID=A0ABS5VV41_9BACT|nr:gliding motility-associated C-terminal domain-containing protein [Chryseosolibacter indicus]MBT1705294.1 gliding motility-associated C-terminal domain-containing protein [Chryseosolibacter indicus]